MKNHTRNTTGIVALATAIALLAGGGCFLGYDGFVDGQVVTMTAQDHTPGFFQDFAMQVEAARATPSATRQLDGLHRTFSSALVRGAAAGELEAAGATWPEVAAYLQTGLTSADAMLGVAGSEATQATMLDLAAERVLGADRAAIDLFNARMERYGNVTGRVLANGLPAPEGLALVLDVADQAGTDVWVESGYEVAGHWEESPGFYEEIWVPGHYETMWQDGYCADEYAGSQCTSYWVDETCETVWVEDGYWSDYCAWWDDWGYCLEWASEWVDQSYTETVCDGGYWVDDCQDAYVTYCEPGGWVDVWVDGYTTTGAWIPGETYWVDPYWQDTSGFEWTLLPREEYDVLTSGIQAVRELGPAQVGAGCDGILADSLARAATTPLRDAGLVLRDGIDRCLGGGGLLAATPAAPAPMAPAPMQ